MNLKAAAQQLDVHYQTVYRWVREGRLAAVKVGGRYEITDEAIEAFRHGNDHAAPSAPAGPGLDADDAVLDLEHLASNPSQSPFQAVLAAARFVSLHVGDVGAVHRVDESGGVDLLALDTRLPALKARVVDIAVDMDLDALAMGDDGMSELVIEHLDQARFDRSLTARSRLLLEGVRVRSIARVPVTGHEGPCGALVSFRIGEKAHGTDDVETLRSAAADLSTAVTRAPAGSFASIPTVTGRPGVARPSASADPVRKREP